MGKCEEKLMLGENPSIVIYRLTCKKTILRLQAANDFFFLGNLLSDFIAQGSFSFVEPLSKIFNGRSILFGLLTSFLTLLQFDGKVISTLISYGESLCRRKSKQKSK